MTSEQHFHSWGSVDDGPVQCVECGVGTSPDLVPAARLSHDRGADADDGIIKEGSLTPGGNRVGPKAWRLIVALSQYDDWLGSVLEVVDEAALSVPAPTPDTFAFDMAAALDPEYAEALRTVVPAPTLPALDAAKRDLAARDAYYYASPPTREMYDEMLAADRALREALRDAV